MHDVDAEQPGLHTSHSPHESPIAMTGPLVLLAAFTILLSLLGTPLWPAFEAYLNGHLAHLEMAAILRVDMLGIMLLSSGVVAIGIGLAWWLYSRGITTRETADPLERIEPDVFALLRQKFYVDEFYFATVLRLNGFFARASDWLDRSIWDAVVNLIAYLVIGLAWMDRALDEFVVNLGFDKSCGSVRGAGRFASMLQTGRTQTYLKVLGTAVALLALIFIWGCRS